MSFNRKVKDELLDVWHSNKCCKLAEMLGLLLLSTDYSDKSIGIVTDSQKQADNYVKLSKKCLNIIPIKTKRTKHYNVFFETKDIPYILNNFNVEIADSLFRCENCKNAFLMGAFLASGVISDPQKEYRIEFVTKSEEISCLLYRILFDYNLTPKMTIKNKKVSVYIKNSESIEDLLTHMGAVKCSLALMNEKIIKDLKNTTNRKTNFETANLKKSADSSAKHIAAIEKIESNGKFDTLPDDLKKIAIARKENLGISLSELGKEFGLSRSGVHHRLKKICEIADKL